MYNRAPNKIKKGEVLVMHTCGEAEHYKGKLWTASSDSWMNDGRESVFLENFSGSFATKFLQVVILPKDKLAVPE